MFMFYRRLQYRRRHTSKGISDANAEPSMEMMPIIDDAAAMA
jgi:hypothetical protein